MASEERNDRLSRSKRLIRELSERSGQRIESTGNIGSLTRGAASLALLKRIPGLSKYFLLPEGVGLAHGALSENSNLSGNSWIPGVSASQAVKRIRKTIDSARVRNPDTEAKKNSIFELAGGYLINPLVCSTAGYILGRMVGGKNSIGPGIGVLAGSSIPVISAAVAAGLNKRRSELEQNKYDDSSHTANNIFTPGYALYNKWKRLGASENLVPNEDDSDDEQIRKLRRQIFINRILGKKDNGDPVYA